ncbi:hypothetical protein Lal_00048376 [Lupinus albus]|nr:hypothetical protein Lal_00048376 [Lupinus albus]
MEMKVKINVFEAIFAASDSATLEQLKELSSKRRAIEESINEKRSITEAIAREMSGGLVSRYEQEYISSCKSLHELKGQEYVAESLKASDQIGAAIAVLHSALINAKKKIPREESWKSIYQKQIHDASEVLRKFEHENYVVWSQNIPSGDELPLPEGNKIVKKLAGLKLCQNYAT